MTWIVNKNNDMINNMKVNSTEIFNKLKQQKKRKREVASFSISEPIQEAFKAKCEKNGVSASAVVQELIIAFLEG